MEQHTGLTMPTRATPGATTRPTTRGSALTCSVLAVAFSLLAGCEQRPADGPTASQSTTTSNSSSSTPSVTPTETKSTDPSTPTSSPVLVVPSTAALPGGPFAVRATTASGDSVPVSAGPGDVCAVQAAKIRPLHLGTCVVTASAGGQTTKKSVQIVKGTPKISWALRRVTPHSVDQRPHGIRSTSDGRVTIRSLTPTQCEIRGSEIKAVARELDGVTSLGPCKVRVDVAETPMWKAAQTVLSSRIVEAAVSLAFARVPATLQVGANAEVVVKLTHPDSSIDNALAVTLTGCGAGATETTVDRRATFQFLAQAPPDDPEASRCTLTASTIINGTTQVVGRGETSTTVGLVGAASSPTQAP